MRIIVSHSRTIQLRGEVHGCPFAPRCVPRTVAISLRVLPDVEEGTPHLQASSEDARGFAHASLRVPALSRWSVRIVKAPDSAGCEDEEGHATCDIDDLRTVLLPVTGLSGETLQVTIQAGTQSGTALRLNGKGLPEVGDKGKGDLFVVVEVRTLTDVSDRERGLLLELAKLQSREAVKKPASPTPWRL